jgi:hypothetical protein
MMIEGPGSGSIPLTSGSGSERPKNMWIRIRNTDKKSRLSQRWYLELDGDWLVFGAVPAASLTAKVVVGQDVNGDRFSPHSIKGKWYQSRKGYVEIKLKAITYEDGKTRKSWRQTRVPGIDKKLHEPNPQHHISKLLSV